jgi:excisionase family DNA binding protein
MTIAKTNVQSPVTKLALTRTEAAQALGVSPQTIDRLVKRKELNPNVRTRRPLFPVTDIERFLKEGTLRPEK